MGAPTPIALDHNFPEPILKRVTEFLPEFSFIWIRELELSALEDHDLIYELGRRGFPVMVTNNHKMLHQLEPLQAIVDTKLTVVALRKSGDDPIFATGVLLRDLRDVLKRDNPGGSYVLVSPSRVEVQNAGSRLAKVRLATTGSGASAGRARQEFERYPDGDARRVR